MFASLEAHSILTHLSRVPAAAQGTADGGTGPYLLLAVIGFGCAGAALIFVCVRVLMGKATFPAAASRRRRDGWSDATFVTKLPRVPKVSKVSKTPERPLLALRPAPDESLTVPVITVAELVGPARGVRGNEPPPGGDEGEWEPRRVPGAPYAMQVRMSRGTEAGESWLKDFLEKVRVALPGIPKEELGSEAPPRDDATLQIDTATLCRVLDEMDSSPKSLPKVPSPRVTPGGHPRDPQAPAPRSPPKVSVVSPDRTMKISAADRTAALPLLLPPAPPPPEDTQPELPPTTERMPNHDAKSDPVLPSARPHAPSSSGLIPTVSAIDVRIRDIGTFNYGARRA